MAPPATPDSLTIWTLPLTTAGLENIGRAPTPEVDGVAPDPALREAVAAYVAWVEARSLDFAGCLERLGVQLVAVEDDESLEDADWQATTAAVMADCQSAVAAIPEQDVPAPAADAHLHLQAIAANLDEMLVSVDAAFENRDPGHMQEAIRRLNQIGAGTEPLAFSLAALRRAYGLP